MASNDTIFVFENPEPFDSPDISATSSTSSSSAPSTSDSNSSLVEDIENCDPQKTIEKLKEKLKLTKKDLNMALDASLELRKRANECEEDEKKLQERLDEYDGVLMTMRTGHVTARGGVKVEVEDWETMVNKTLGRNEEPALSSPDSTSANLEFLKKLTEDTENLTIEINRTRMIEKENMLRIKALENTLANTRQKNASEKHNLYNTVEELQNKLTTAQNLNESLRSAKDRSEDVTKEILRRSVDNSSKRFEELLKAQLEKDAQIAQLIEELGMIHSRADVAEDLVHQQTTSIGELTLKNKNLQNRLRIQEEGFSEEQRRLNTAYNRLHADFKSLERSKKEQEKELETQKKMIEKISRQNEGVEKQLADMEKASLKNTKLMNGLREQNEDLVQKLSKRKEEIRELKDQLKSQANISNTRLRIVSDSARNSPRIQLRQKVKVEEDVECRPDSDSDDIIVTKQVVPKRARQMSSPAKSASKKLKL